MANEWLNNEYKLIRFNKTSAGADISDASLSAWLTENAEQFLQAEFDLNDVVMSGEHTITCNGRATGYQDSEASNSVTITVYAIQIAATGCSYVGAPYLVLNGSPRTLTFTASEGYSLPSSVTATNCTSSWNQSTGVLTLSDPTGSPSVTVTATQQKLDTPLAVMLDDVTFAVTAVAHATHYDIYADNVKVVNQKVVEAGNMNTDLSTLGLSVGSHSITAVMTGAPYADSDPSIAVTYVEMAQLDTPTNLSVSGTTATFDEVENAESYEFFVDDVSIGTYTPVSGYTVVMSNNEYDSFIGIYDGTDDTGIYLGSNDGTYIVTSGHLAVVNNSQSIFSDGTVTGGVAVNSALSTNMNSVYDVTGDGTISYAKYCCFVEGTKITLADRTTKNVEDITYDDDLLVWDFYEGKFGTAKPMWIAPEHTADYYYRVEIEGGTVLKLVGSDGKSHRLYDYEGKQFSYPQDMGRNHTIDQNYKGLHIENIERVDEPVKYYNVITDTHYNLYAEGILTSCRLSNRYGIAQPFSRTCSQMKYDTNDVKMTEEEVQAYIDALER